MTAIYGQVLNMLVVQLILLFFRMCFFVFTHRMHWSKGKDHFIIINVILIELFLSLSSLKLSAETAKIYKSMEIIEFMVNCYFKNPNQAYIFSFMF